MKNIMTMTLALVASFTLNAQDINDLDFLIGSWEVTETLYPGTDRTWQENGTRTCEYWLDGQFIKCESVTVDSRNGNQRTYAYFFNYHEKEDCFLVTSFAHDFPLHGQHKWFLNKEEKVIQAISPKNVIGDQFFRATISYADPNRIIWNGWRSKFTEDKAWFQVFNDVTVRK
ncbi:MAG: hypothetical protein RIC80_22900 [Cyclobacteriaceae bacterium]